MYDGHLYFIKLKIFPFYSSSIYSCLIKYCDKLIPVGLLINNTCDNKNYLTNFSEYTSLLHVEIGRFLYFVFLTKSGLPSGKYQVLIVYSNPC